MDVVYYVRPGDRNEELRYSLRSLINLPHDRVWMVGYKPSWVTGVEYVPRLGTGSPQENAVGHLRLACERVEADRFCVFNDDFYVMQPLPEVPSLHAGLLRDRARMTGGAYGSSLKTALALLGDEAIAWNLHIPVVIERGTLADILPSLRGKVPPEWRTMYGNLSGATGTKAPDVKVNRSRDPLPDGPFLSTRDGTLPYVRTVLDEHFPGASRYEVAS